MILIFWKKKIVLNSKSIPGDVESYDEFFTFFELKRSIKVPSRVATSISLIIVHILASSPKVLPKCLRT